MPSLPATRIAYVASAAWAGVVAAYGNGGDWWGAMPRLVTFVPVALLCILAAVSPTEPRTRWAASALSAFAVGQMIRVQWGGYGWRANLVATSTYGLVAALGAVMLLHTTLLYLMSAGQGSVSDRAGP